MGSPRKTNPQFQRYVLHLKRGCQGAETQDIMKNGLTDTTLTADDPCARSATRTLAFVSLPVIRRIQMPRSKTQPAFGA